MRDYIVHELQALGIAAAVERQTGFYRESVVAFRGGIVENIVGRIPGSANTKAVMLACHYDSVVEGAGAGDDGHGVAVLLETARALRHQSGLRNDVLLLFTDGEEPDMMGGEAFLSQSRFRQDVGLVLNFDARGTGGPGLMFETSQPDGALIREFARAAPYPRASSFFRDVYERMPSATDFTFFNRKGIPGLNFAFIEGGAFYHTSEDNLARLDVRSLQHQGSYALSLVRNFGGLALPLAPAPNSVYFNIANLLVHYPLAWAPAIEGVLLGCWMLAVFAGRKRGQLRAAGMLRGAAGVAAIIIGTALCGQGYLWLLNKLHLIRNELMFGQEYGRWWLLAAFVAAAGMAAIGLTARLVKRTGRIETMAGAALVQIALAGVLCWKAPAASHLEVAGAVSGMLLFGIFLASPKSRTVWLAGSIAALLPALMLWAPLARHLDAGPGVKVWPVQAFLAAQFLTLAATAFSTAPSLAPTRWAIAAMAVSVVLLSIGLLSAPYGARDPRPSNVFYALDADRHTAFWVSRENTRDPWAAQLLGAHPKHEPFPQISPWWTGQLFWRSPAPELLLPAPELTVLHTSCQNDFRTFDIQARSPRGAPAMIAVFQSDRATEIVSLNGREPSLFESIPRAEVRAQYIDMRAIPGEGMALRVRIRGCGKLRVRLVERSNDIEAALPHQVSPLPSGIMTAWEDDYYNRSVMVTRLLILE
ncbi:MAG TPA: M28 family peptidase [Bryobacteraceae bacterium]|nr:M28 family peptidase [Bryobacteraceae bacterium]